MDVLSATDSETDRASEPVKERNPESATERTLGLLIPIFQKLVTERGRVFQISASELLALLPRDERPSQPTIYAAIKTMEEQHLVRVESGGPGRNPKTYDFTGSSILRGNGARPKRDAIAPVSSERLRDLVQRFEFLKDERERLLTENAALREEITELREALEANDAQLKEHEEVIGALIQQAS